MANWNAISRAFDHRVFDVRSDTNAYHALHKWMNRSYPLVGRCEWCGKKRRTVYAVAEPGRYSRNRADWLELCIRCHNVYDGCADRLPDGQRGEAHGRARLTKVEVGEIRKMHLAGLSYRVLGRRFGVAPGTIGRIARGETWA